MALMGFREYARHRGVSLKAVQKAIIAGRIGTQVIEGREKIDAEAADRAWAATTDPGRQSLLHSATPISTQPDDDADDAPQPSDSDDYRTARAGREKLRLQREQLELDQLRGKLADIDELRRIGFTAFRSLRDAILNVPARIKDQCAAETDPLTVERLIEAELMAVLASFDPARAISEAPDDPDADETD